jgi:competence protein ComEC
VRFTVERAAVSQGTRRCGIERLVVRARSGVDRAIEAGTEVELSGKWRPLERPGRWPRANDRAGFVSAAHVGARRVITRRGLATRLRAAAGSKLRRHLPADVVPAARALILAERDELTPQVKRTFAAAGLAHLLAISGLHVGILSGGLLLMAGPFTRRRRHIVAAVATWGYVCVIGLPASAVRAAILLSLYAASRTRGRPVSMLDAVGAAAVLLLIVQPMEILNPGFQLSFAGFLGLIAGSAAGSRLTSSDWVRRWLQRCGRIRAGGRSVSVRARAERAIRGLAAGVGAFVATAPIAAAHFQQVAPVAVVGHVAGTPLVALGLWSLAGVVVAPSPLAGAIAGAATLALRLLTGLATALADLSFGHAAVGPPTLAAWMAATALLVSPFTVSCPAGGSRRSPCLSRWPSR